MRSKSMKMKFVASIRHKLCMTYAFFDFFCLNIIFDKKNFLIAEINLTSRGPLYTCLVLMGDKSTNVQILQNYHYWSC